MEQQAEYKTATTVEPKYYRCQGCKRILGHIEYHNRIARLYLRENEYYIARITGDADIECMRCGVTTPWSPSARAMADMLERRRGIIEKYERELEDG